MAGTALFARFAGQNDPGLYLVYPPNDGRNCVCDVFVVHGLRGGATKTWQHPDSGIVWFQHLLPDLLRDISNGDNARIWTFGYPADVTFQTSSIYDFAQVLLSSVDRARKGYENRKIIWICHSLGGLIVKKALVDADIPKFRSIRSSTVGIVFLATPHQGSASADLGSVVSSVVSAALPGFNIFNRSVFKDLKRNSNTLFEISGKFSHICTSMTIHSYHETRPQGGTQVIVDRNSAILNLNNEVTRYGLDSNHMNMGKFRDAYDHNWQPVASSITELVLLAMPTPLTSNPTPPQQPAPTWRGPPASNPSPAPTVSRTVSRPQGSRQPSSYSQSRSGWQPNRGSPLQPATPLTPSSLSSSRGSSASTYPSFDHAHSRTNLRPPDHQQASTGRAFSPASRAGSPAPPRVDPDDISAYCDVCMQPIGSSEFRAMCQVCYDYDLCAGCLQDEKESKNHSKEHKVTHVLSTQILGSDDLVPVRDAINPRQNAAGTKANWSITELPPNTEINPTDRTVCRRDLHLFDYGSHARFRAYSKPGHFGIAIDISVRFDPGMNPNVRRQLIQRQGGVGLLRVTLGPVRNNSQFSGTRFTDDTFNDSLMTVDCLPNKLLFPFWGAVYTITLGDDNIELNSRSVLHVTGTADSLVDLGLILQWSGVAAYEISNDPVVSLSVDRVRMYNVMNYAEPYVRPSPPPKPQPPLPPPAPASAAQVDERDETVSAEEFFAALLRIQQEVQSAKERAMLEALMKRELERQNEQMRQAVARMLREEQARQEQLELIRLLRAMGL